MLIRAFFIGASLLVVGLVPLVGVVSGWLAAAAFSLVLAPFFALMWLLWQMVLDDEAWERRRQVR